MYPIGPPQPANGEPGNAHWIETNADRTATILLPEGEAAQIYAFSLYGFNPYDMVSL